MRIILICILFISCNSSKLGKSKIGADGAVISGTNTNRCSHPTKVYAKSLEIKVQNALDSTLGLPFSKLNLGVNQTVTKLGEYSPEGLDMDLILFRLCQISLNKGFTANQTEELLKIAIASWEKKKNSQ